MLSLTDGTFVEDFFYGYPYDEIVTRKPPEFDYVGAAMTSAGILVCEPGEFSMHYGSNDPNPDIYTPYGGAESGQPYYLRFPVLSWDDSAGIFFTVTTTDNALLSFDRSFSGYIGDRLYVVVNDIERASISASAGYPWTSTEIPLGKGTYRIAIMLKTAPYTSGTIREGVAQASDTITELYRYLRICNLRVTNVGQLPTSEHQTVQMLADSSATLLGSVEVTSGRLLWSAGAALLALTKTSKLFDLRPEVTLTLTPTVGQEGQASWSAESTLAMTAAVEVHHVSDSGTLGFASTASLTVDDPEPLDIRALIRPLRKTTMTMTRPVMAGGRPVTPLAVCETEVLTTAETTDALISKIDPYSPKNTVPTAVGGLDWRWLSIDAQRGPLDRELISWLATDRSGPAWSTPGSYRPTVDHFTMRTGTTAFQVRYPAVHFDATHLDHLATTLPAVSATGQMTWAFVGSFSRFRGALTDSCPILDFAADAEIDYDTEQLAVRGTPPDWTDEATESSVYLGLASYGAAEPTISRLAYRSDDAAAVFVRSDKLVISDNTPMILIYSVNAGASFITLAPLVGASGSLTVAVPRGAVDHTLASFCLGKARVPAPFGGGFLTGTMSLLEVSFAARALSKPEAEALAAFYASLYAPVANAQTVGDLTNAGAHATGTPVTQALIYAADPETPYALLSGDRAVVLDAYPSDADIADSVEDLLAAGVPVIECSNADYAAIVANLETE